MEYRREIYFEKKVSKFFRCRNKIAESLFSNFITKNLETQLTLLKIVEHAFYSESILKPTGCVTSFLMSCSATVILSQSTDTFFNRLRAKNIKLVFFEKPFC